MDSIIQLEEVSKIYKMGEVEVPAVKNANVRINRGEFVAIMGPSGSGKSTMMNLVGCLDVPTNGKIFLDNDNIASLSDDDLAKIRGKKIGFIFQRFNLINSLTARENVTLVMSFQGVSRPERRKRAEKLLEKVGLKNRMHHLPAELSGGEQQRVAIARSLANDPDVILADEPTGNLDTKTGIKIMNFLVELNKLGKTVIVVTHDPKQAKYANRIIKIQDGMIK